MGRLLLTTTVFLLSGVFSIVIQASQSPEVKKSNSGICHQLKISPYYDTVKKYTEYQSLQACFDSGGRLPKKLASNPSGNIFSSPQNKKYDRSKFEHWINVQGCINTRHALLLEQSTSIVDRQKNQCTMNYGRWYDPYSGKTFTNARDLDIDHVFPLFAAWNRGASEWSDGKRRDFANDRANLLAVEAKLNREKKALLPNQWMPPNKEFHCQYLLRFLRVTKKYGLNLKEKEKIEILNMKNEKCKGI